METERLYNIRRKKLNKLRASIVERYKKIYESQNQELDAEYIHAFFYEVEQELLRL